MLASHNQSIKSTFSPKYIAEHAHRTTWFAGGLTLTFILPHVHA